MKVKIDEHKKKLIGKFHRFKMSIPSYTFLIFFSSSLSFLFPFYKKKISIRFNYDSNVSQAEILLKENRQVKRERERKKNDEKSERIEDGEKR